jgi:hypothetical protein
MIAQIGPLVQAGGKTGRLLVAHAIGGALGGTLLGVTAGIAAVGAQHLGDERLSVAALSAVLLLVGLADLQLIRIALPLTRQTPRGWTCSFGVAPGVFAWGVDLGLGLTTRLPALSFLALPLSAIAVGSFSLAVLILAIYGFARATIVTAAVALSRDRWVVVSATLAVHATLARRATGAAALLLSVALATQI